MQEIKQSQGGTHIFPPGLFSCHFSVILIILELSSCFVISVPTYLSVKKGSFIKSERFAAGDVEGENLDLT